MIDALLRVVETKRDLPAVKWRLPALEVLARVCRGVPGPSDQAVRPWRALAVWVCVRPCVCLADWLPGWALLRTR